MVRKYSESVFHVLRLDGLPTPIFTIIFFTAPHFGRILAVTAHFALERILRKRVYSFKHSGILRGRHRGSEKVCPDQRSGLKLSDFQRSLIRASNFVKEQYSISWLTCLTS